MRVVGLLIAGICGQVCFEKTKSISIEEKAPAVQISCRRLKVMEFS